MGDFGNLIVDKGFKKWPKVQKIANLVTLLVMPHQYQHLN